MSSASMVMRRTLRVAVIEIDEAVEGDGVLAVVEAGEVEAGIGEGDLEGEDLDGLAVEDVGFFPGELGFGGGSKTSWNMPPNSPTE